MAHAVCAMAGSLDSD